MLEVKARYLKIVEWSEDDLAYILALFRAGQVPVVMEMTKPRCFRSSLRF